MTYYYWNAISMGGPADGFIQEEPDEIELKPYHRGRFVLIGNGECLQDAIDQYGADNLSQAMIRAIERDYE